MKNGKIADTNEKLRELQALFIEKGFSFVHAKEPFLIRDCDFLFFQVFQQREFVDGKFTGKLIDVKCLTVEHKTSIHNNRNIFNLKFYDGEVYFKKHHFRKRSFESVIEFLGEIKAQGGGSLVKKYLNKQLIK